MLGSHVFFPPKPGPWLGKYIHSALTREAAPKLIKVPAACPTIAIPFLNPGKEEHPGAPELEKASRQPNFIGVSVARVR